MSTNFNPTPAELTIVNQVFAHADPQKLGVLTGDVAVRVFGGAKLAPVTLGEIWNIADEENKGWLPKRGVAIAVRLIGWAQKGDKITQALVNKPGPLAVIEGITTVSQQNTGMSAPKSPPPTAFPPLTPQDKAKFQNMFIKSGPVSGLLSGEKARDVFVKSKLPTEHLMKIWNLADTQDRGALDATDFAIGMYFIQGMMTGKLSFIPTALPPGLYQQAGGSTPNPSSLRSQMTGNSGSFSPVSSNFAPQQTSQSHMLLPDHTGMSGPFRAPALPARPSAFPQTNGHSDWDVTQSEKVGSDRYFDTLDTQKRGFIEGDVAVPFMLKSQLPGEVLAQVWDLADINNDGRLTRDGFAVAMHLIQKKLAGQEVPETLPASLIPPSLRGSATGQSPFSPLHTQTHQQSEPVVDLFSFDDAPSPVQPPVQPQPRQVSGILKPQSTGPTPGYMHPSASRTTIDSDPFSGSFQSSPHKDFLGDDDDHGTRSPPIHDQSAEIGNVKNQLQSTERSLATSKEERQNLEQTLANQASQLSTLQTQLSSAKAAYETETTLLATLKERRATQVADIQKTREELIRAESDLSGIRVEKSEIEGAFLRDKEEARDLHRRMVEAGQQAEALKADVEKLKKEAKQQKGLLAIARKQLSTKEAEKHKAEKEHDESVAEVSSINEEKNAVDASIASLEASPSPNFTSPLSRSDSLAFAASQPLPGTPDPSQQMKSSSNNPFERLAMASGASTPRSQSPFIGLQHTIISSPPPPSINGIESTVDVPKAEEPNLFDRPSSTTNMGSSFLGEDPSAHAPEAVFSPNTDYFVTPPSSATGIMSPPIVSDDAAAKFPSLDEIPTPDLPAKAPSPAPTAPVAPSVPAHAETDLNSQLKELEVEESDSDSDSEDESDDAPVKPAIAQSTTNGKAAPQAPPVNGTKDVTSPAAAPAASFDDIFGDDKPQEPAPVPAKATTPFDAFISDAVDLTKDVSSPPLAATHVAGVSEFDEALGKSPAATSATPANFSFDDAFDDNFDFNSAKAVGFPPVGAPAATPTPSKKDTAPISNFDDIFGTANNVASPAPMQAITTPAKTASNGNANGNPPKVETSFEEAFSGFDSVTGPKPLTSPVPPVMPARSTEQSIPGAFPSQPSSPIAVAPASRVANIRASSSPPRERSKTPPPRIVSPKPRLSSSSSKEVERPKEPPPRHSKLSIRLPFGKKKKPQEPLPMPSSHLSPPIEEPERVATPASEDDVDAVKQLTAMGFSRGQAVDALEKYAYDVQRALNSLLGNQ